MLSLLSLHLWHLLHAPPPHQRGGWRVQLHPCAKDTVRALTSISQHTPPELIPSWKNYGTAWQYCTFSDPPQLPNWAEFATFCPRKKKKLDLRRQGGLGNFDIWYERRRNWFCVFSGNYDCLRMPVPSCVFVGMWPTEAVFDSRFLAHISELPQKMSFAASSLDLALEMSILFFCCTYARTSMDS